MFVTSLSSPASFGIQVSCIYLHFIVAENKKKVFMYPYLTISFSFFFMIDKL